MLLKSTRFVLRDFTMADTAAFLEYHSDPRSTKFYKPHETTREYAESLVSTFREWAESRPRQNFQLAVFRLQDPSALVGCVGLRTEGTPSNEAEFGIEMAPQYWGMAAYAIEIASTMLEFGFMELGVETVVGTTVAGNSRVARLAQWYGAETVADEAGDDSELRWRLSRRNWLRYKHGPTRRTDGPR